MSGRGDTPDNPPGGDAPPSLAGGRGLEEEDKQGEPRLEGGAGECCSLQFLLGNNSSWLVVLLVNTSPLPPWSGVDTRYTESWILDGLVAGLGRDMVRMRKSLRQLAPK